MNTKTIIVMPLSGVISQDTHTVLLVPEITWFSAFPVPITNSKQINPFSQHTHTVLFVPEITQFSAFPVPITNNKQINPVLIPQLPHFTPLYLSMASWLEFSL